VPLDEPHWWYREDRPPVAAGLAPIGAIYGWVARSRFALARPYRSRLPVLCAGNFTAGGTGKTPLTLHLCQRLRELGKQPVVLMRGYGRRSGDPHWVEAGDTADDVGDEALLLARGCRVLVASDRAAGARSIELSRDASTIVMDDGLQNPQLAKDLAIALVDGSRGLGNGHVIPAGPLRAPLSFQFQLTDAIIVNEIAPGAGDRVAGWLRERFKGPVLRCVTTAAGDTSWLAGQRILAWAGIGAPQRFFAMLEALGGKLVEPTAFRDHHRLGRADAERLLSLARRNRAMLISTEKDLARLQGTRGRLAELAASTRALPIRLHFSERDGERLAGLVERALNRPYQKP
jgi:tetraacyldisaccharide 4'-kinase